MPHGVGKAVMQRHGSGYLREEGLGAPLGCKQGEEAGPLLACRGKAGGRPRLVLAREPGGA